ASIPATDPAKLEECTAAGAALRGLLERDLRPRDTMTRAAFENAMTLVTVLGGSTNALLPLIPVAHAAGAPLGIDDLLAVSDRTPCLADLKPSGRYVLEDRHRAGGVRPVLRRLVDAGFVDGSGMTVAGRTLEENVRELPGLTARQ